MGSGVCRSVAVPLALIDSDSIFRGRILRDCMIGDLIIRNGIVVGFEPTENEVQGIVTPRLTEAHCHLDKCHTIDRLVVTGGSLLEAISAQEQDKIHWTAEDIRKRAERGLSELFDAGCRFVRTHVDCRLDPSQPSRMPLAWEILGELAQEWRNRLSLQRAALLPIDDCTDAISTRTLARRIAADKGALGAFILDQSVRSEGIATLVRVAGDIGVPLDFHVDESIGTALDGLCRIAEAVISFDYEGPVLCGHACSLMDVNGDNLKRRLDQVAAAGLSIVSLPASNLLLQSRGNGTPDRRGITRVKELMARGIPVSFGSDNVRDAFAPIGRHDPLHSLYLGILGAQLEQPLAQWISCITLNAQIGVEGSAPLLGGARADDLLFWPVPSASELLSIRPSPRSLVLERG
ncbi:amidohydrolase family protein [Microvirga brassicacearum]|nr:amidohydrolase family protein [Microvirga brassicacearum]